MLVRLLIPWVVLISVLSPATLHAKEREYRGRVVQEDKSGLKQPIAGVEVKIAGFGNSTTTTAHGEFIIKLPDSLPPGKRIQISVILQGWRISVPPNDGETHVPSDEAEVLSVILLPNDSPKFLPEDQIERKYLPVNPIRRKPKLEDGHNGAIPQDEYVPSVFLDGTQKLSRLRTEKLTLDQRKISRTILTLSGSSLPMNPQHRSTKLNAFPTYAGQDSCDADAHIRDGDQYYETESFAEALEAYQRAINCLGKDEVSSHQQAVTMVTVGLAHYQIGIRGSAHVASMNLNAALSAYRQAAEFFTKQGFMEDWALVQINLGNALSEKGIRATGEDGRRLLAQAVRVYREALATLISNRAHTDPEAWATIHVNLANTLSEQATRAGGEQAKHLYREAQEHYQAALLNFDAKNHPQQWAATCLNLGNSLAEQGIFSDKEEGIRLLTEAVENYRAALSVYTRYAFPIQWATAQSNLGVALKNQAIRFGGADSSQLIDKAIVAFKEALTVHTKEQFPQQWAATQNNLGGALREQGHRISGEEGRLLLYDASMAYRAALTVYAKDSLPQQWAITQNNFGATLTEIGLREVAGTSEENFSRAVRANRDALKVYSKERFPQDWATTQNNLGTALKEQGIRTGGEAGKELVRQAVAAFQLALEVRTREALPVQWEQTMNNLEIAKKALEEMK
jgi:tetratricopeptide (TPR) repeat protein